MWTTVVCFRPRDDKIKFRIVFFYKKHQLGNSSPRAGGFIIILYLSTRSRRSEDRDRLEFIIKIVATAVYTVLD